MKKMFFLLFIIFFMTASGFFNCSYTKEEVDSMINDLDDEISSQKQPRAYGTINTIPSTPEVIGGSGNFTVSRIGGTGYFAVNINEYSLFDSEYITVVASAEGDNTPGYVVWETNGGVLWFYTYNSSGISTDLIFSFMIWEN